MTDGKVTNLNVGQNQNTSHFSWTYRKILKFVVASQHWIIIKAEIEALVALNLPNDVLCL